MPLALQGRPEWAPSDPVEEPIVEEPTFDLQVYQEPPYQQQHFHGYQQGRASSYAPPTSMDELFADFRALRMDVHTIGNALQDHRRSCAARWEDEDRRRVADEARWAAEVQRKIGRAHV